MLWSVIVVAKGMWPFTERCLNSLTQTWPTSDRLEIIYIDNGTPLGENSWQSASVWASGKQLPVKMLRFVSPVNLSVAWNAGLDIASGENLLVINNDLIFHSPGWLEAFSSGLANLDVGIVGITGMSWSNIPFIQGSIFAFRRDILDRVGNFDEQFDFTCEDTDFSKRIQDNGYSIKSYEYLRGGVIEHLEGATRNYYRDDTTKYQLLAHISRIKFCYKWQLEIRIHD